MKLSVIFMSILGYSKTDGDNICIIISVRHVMGSSIDGFKVGVLFVVCVCLIFTVNPRSDMYGEG